MAVLPKNQTTQNTQAGGNGNATTGTGTGEFTQTPITLQDLLKKDMGKVAMNFDYEEDAWERAAPPPAGRYSLKIFLGQDGYSYGYNDPKNPKDADLYITAPLMCKIQSDDPELKDVIVFTRVNTRIYRGKNISTLVGLITKGLGKAALAKYPSLNIQQQVQLFDKFLAREPVIEAEIDWQGSYKGPDDKWVNALKTYDDFPDDPDNPGKKLHECTITAKDGTSVDIRAMVQVVTWYAKGEESKAKKKGTHGGQVVQPLQFATAGNAPSPSPSPNAAPLATQHVAQGLPIVGGSGQMVQSGGAGGGSVADAPTKPAMGSLAPADVVDGDLELLLG